MNEKEILDRLLTRKWPDSDAYCDKELVEQIARIVIDWANKIDVLIVYNCESNRLFNRKVLDIASDLTVAEGRLLDELLAAAISRYPNPPIWDDIRAMLI